MRPLHLLLCAIGCAISIRAADSYGPLSQQLRVRERGRLLVRYSEVESNSVRVVTTVSTTRYRNAGQQQTNYFVHFRYADMPDAAVHKTFEVCRGERIEIRGRDGLTSVAGRLRSIREPKNQKSTLEVEFETMDDAGIAAGYLAGRTRRPKDAEQTDGGAT